MASAIFNPPYLSSSSSLSPTILTKPPIYASHSTSQISHSKTLIIRSLNWVPQLGLAQISAWNGLRRNGFSISLPSLGLERRRKCKRKSGVFASLFGVGAPEALVIGVVALLVFGPKGLAEVAKNLGKTLRAFQPTIRELQEVSREFKSTLEKEIGLDELQNPVQGNYTSATTRESSSPSPSPAVSPDDSESTAATQAITAEDSPETETTSAAATDVFPPTVTTPAVSPEEPWETTTAPAVTTEDSQPTVDPTNGSTSSKAYSSEEILKITEEQLKAIQPKQQISSESESESESASPSQDS